ncbi:MAG: response regulator, partial [Candidatus Anammoxibacter sp.]
LTENGKLYEIFSADDEDEVLVTHVQCSIWSFGKEDIDLVLPVDIAEELFNEKVTTSTRKAIAHIMYVDSEKNDIAVLKKILRNSEYDLHVCGGADMAISTLQQKKIDMVIIEAGFGGNGDEGLALCLRIKRNMLLDNIPIVMTSVNATKKLVLDCIRIGTSDFIVKPLTKDKLSAKLDKLIGKQKSSI